ncbi:hypothetical protein B0H66DRAFT_536266 [Apodospora peruviana]|uniref:FAD-binding domain-containing protein n=1 Tax=Apodospora peruviana TaxID=516989 RepID=A0AAE0HYQ3_9PEZI|nr:hypothetical protein B0H66DRAFT_536266 [Apodospora peruviana]
MTPPRVAIIGAGPTGTMLARLLHLANIPVVIFEADASPNYRSQGGTLDLHPPTGLAALKQAGLFEKFLEKARYDGDALQITDKDLRVYLKVEPTSTKHDNSTTPVGGGGGGVAKQIAGQRPEIDRFELRKLLLESLPPDTIRWNMRLKRLSSSPSSNKPVLEFDSGQTETGFDLVVGADGAWSKVRSSFLSSVIPTFAGIGLIHLSIPDAEKTSPEVYRAVNRGNMFAYSTGKFLAVQQMGDGSINVYAQTTQKDPHNWTTSEKWFHPDDANLTRSSLISEGGPFADWHPILREAIQKATAQCVPRTLFQLPIGFTWDHKPGATLIGDAAHLMTPFAGEGVNVGLEDAMKLAQAIIGAKEGELDGAVRAYEAEMFPRAAKVAKLTDELRLAWMFTPGSPGSVIAKTTAMHVNKHAPGVLHPFVKMVVYGYFAGRKVVRGY